MPQIADYSARRAFLVRCYVRGVITDYAKLLALLAKARSAPHA